MAFDDGTLRVRGTQPLGEQVKPSLPFVVAPPPCRHSEPALADEPFHGFFDVVGVLWGKFR